MNQVKGWIEEEKLPGKFVPKRNCVQLGQTQLLVWEQPWQWHGDGNSLYTLKLNLLGSKKTLKDLQLKLKKN